MIGSLHAIGVLFSLTGLAVAASRLKLIFRLGSSAFPVLLLASLLFSLSFNFHQYAVHNRLLMDSGEYQAIQAYQNLELLGRLGAMMTAPALSLLLLLLLARYLFKEKLLAQFMSSRLRNVFLAVLLLPSVFFNVVQHFSNGRLDDYRLAQLASVEGNWSDLQEGQQRRTPHQADITAILERVGSSNDIQLIDIRDDGEYEGVPIYCKSAVHIRQADLAERVRELRKFKAVYLFCLGGYRSSDLIERLREKGVNAYFFLGGLGGWIDECRPFLITRQGNELKSRLDYLVHLGIRELIRLRFRDPISFEGSERILSSSEVEKLMNKGEIALLDPCASGRFAPFMTGVVNVPLQEIPSSRLDSALGRIPRNLKIVTVYNDFGTGLLALELGNKLVKRGYTFLGRYARPSNRTR